MKLKISEDIELPLDAVTQTMAIVARKRVGKTYTASVIAEEFIEHKIPIVVLDPTGVWWGLRSSASGKREGYPVVIIGGAHADVPLEETAGDVIADLVVDHPGYYVIDFSQIESDSAIHRFATAFAKRFYFRKEQHRFPVHLFIDEADVFIPQNPFKEENYMLHAFDVIVRRGGVRGIGVTMITQRPAVLNKNVLTQAETLIALQISGSQDVDAIEHWIRLHGSKEEKQKFLSTVATLQKGVAWLWSPSWLQTFKQIHIRERTTFNSSATPKAGEEAIVPTKLAPVDIMRLGEKIKATIEHQKENEPAELKKALAALRLENQKLIALKPKAETQIETKEIYILTAADRKLLEAARKAAESGRQICNQLVDKFCVTILKIEGIEKRAEEFQNFARMPAPVVPIQLSRPAPKPAAVREVAAPENPGEMTGTQQKILNMIVAIGVRGMTPDKDMIARWMDIHPNGSRYGSDLARLRETQAIQGCELTSYGLSLAKSIPTGMDALKTVLDGTQKKIVEVLEQNTQRTLSKEELAEMLGIHPNGSRFGSDLARLRTMGVIPERGAIKLNESAFK